MNLNLILKDVKRSVLSVSMLVSKRREHYFSSKIGDTGRSVSSTFDTLDMIEFD